ncbi:hypothetical protein [Methylobacterium sp. J-068]|uniref:hypothetical protein n=1 Tax=Methylobacterium sp. J-068 TaxID=2836649 RepID=UPI001FB8911B|nr:hypothetical protein [Methylobacterium sp. J-068]
MSERRRSRPDFDPLTEAQLLAGRTADRRVLLQPTSSQDLGELLTAIEHVTEAATGERSFLHLKPLAAYEAVIQQQPSP